VQTKNVSQIKSGQHISETFEAILFVSG